MKVAEETIEPPPGYFKLSVATGSERVPGFTNMNPAAGPNSDIVHPVDEYPWPFEDATVIEVRIGPYICQLGNLDLFMGECWRVLVNGGALHVMAPYYTSQTYFRNPRNILPIADDTFSFYNVRWLKANGVERIMPCDFEFGKRAFFYTEQWELIGDQAREYARVHYFNVVETVEMIMTAVKPPRKL
jgi:hypothetical protein